MQSAEKITSRIINEARQAAEAMLMAAQAKADEKLAETRTQAAELLKQAQRDAALAAEDQKKRRLSATESELRKEILATRRKLVDAVFEQALERLVTMPPDEQVAMLAPLIVEASPYGNGEIILTKKDAANFGDKLIAAAAKLYKKKVALKLSESSLNARGGMIVRINNIEYNNTYEALLKVSREELESKVAAVLFAGESKDSAGNAES